MCIRLFISFFKIGLFTFGGGFAMLPLMRDELIKKHGWITDEELLDYFSLSQCTPGVIAVNVSTFVGYKVNGWLGAFASTSAVILPSLVVILSIASILKQFMENPYVNAAFNGVRVVVVALMTDILLMLRKKNLGSVRAAVYFCVMLPLVLWGGFSPVAVVVCTFAYSLISSKIRRRAA